jgi:hypothetical protein
MALPSSVLSFASGLATVLATVALVLYATPWFGLGLLPISTQIRTLHGPPASARGRASLSSTPRLSLRSHSHTYTHTARLFLYLSMLVPLTREGREGASCGIRLSARDVPPHRA